MVGKTLFLAAITGFVAIPIQADASIVLGTAGDYSVLAGTTITNTGATTLIGDVGLHPGTSITGFGTVTLTGTIHQTDAAALQAKNDLTAAYTAAAGLLLPLDMSGIDLGGLTLTPGVYSFTSSAQLTGVLKLDSQGDPNAEFVFQIGSVLTAASGSKVMVINGGALEGSTVFWQVGDSATLGIGAAFEGHILALNSITLDTGAGIIYGSALARNGAVTLDANNITTAVPEPATLSLILTGSVLLMRRKNDPSRI